MPQGGSQLNQYWESHERYSGLGYNRSPKLDQSDASFMRELPDFIPPANGEFAVNVTLLPKFKDSKAHAPRRIELYTPPLLIVPQSPRASSTSAVRDRAIFLEYGKILNIKYPSSIAFR